ncbi:MAG: prolyl oligopeptidase family serine peptidase [Pyrinomonadaceae bacterium]
MMNKGCSIKFSLILLLALCVPAFGKTVSDDAAQLRWLVAGAFQSQGSNALFKDYLAPQNETNLRAKTSKAAGKNSLGIVRWQEADKTEDGAIDFSKMFPNEKSAVVYAYAEINAPTAQTLAATIGSGNNIQVRLNGEIVLESRLSRKPEADKDTLVLPLRKGLNTILVKMEGGGNDWKLWWTTHQPTGKLFVNQHNTIIPDFRVNEAVSAWGQIEIANASGEQLKNVTIEAVGDDLILPSRSEAISLKPAEIRRVPVWISAKRSANQTDEKPIRLRVAAGGAEQFIEFKPRVREADGYFVTTYRSAVDSSVQPFSVLLPASFNPEKTYPLILLLHRAHVTDWAQNIISYDAKDWAIQVAVHDRGNNRYRDIGEVDIDEVLREVKRRYRIDDEKIYLAGHSMGGYGTWWQATRRPDMWASISPQAGYTDYTLYLRGESAKTQNPFQKRLLESWSPLNFAENLLHVPAFVVHGAKDDNVSVEHSRKMTARLRELGYKFDYYENPEGGHWWGPRGKNYGVEVADSPKIWQFLRQTKQRADAPRKVIYKTDTLHYNKAYWVTIDELEKANQMSLLQAEIAAPNQISVRAENIKQFTLDLNEKLVETNQPVTIKINNQTAFQGALPSSKRLTLRLETGGFLQILKKNENRETTLAAELDSSGRAARFFERENPPLQKTPEIYGRISDAFNKPFLFVVGTKGNDAKSIALNKAAERAAASLAREWMMRADGIAEIKRDVDVTAADINSRNLILFGSANTNAIIAEINPKLPIKFNGAGLIANGQRIVGEDLGMVLIAPNPLQKNRYAVVVGGTTPKSFETASRLNFNELPDFVIFDRRTLAGERQDFVGGGFFNKFWQLDDMSQIGRDK